MTTIYLTSDTHFFHKNIITYCDRPFQSVEEMNQKLIENWNNTVGNLDEVWFLGDFSFGSVDQTKWVLDQLHGIKHLILGNHDRIGRCEKLFRDEWRQWFLDKHDYYRLHHDNKKAVLCHFPFESWERGYYNFHGHTHGTYKSKWMQHDVGVDVNGYVPISWNEAVWHATDSKENINLY